MKFMDKLNEYMEIIGCSSRELSIKSGISESVISRYRSGDRTPKEGSMQINKIVSSIVSIAKDNNISDITEDEVLNSFINSIKDSAVFDYDYFSQRLNELILNLKINVSDMARYIGFDASHISRIRYNMAKPSDPIDFCQKVCNYIVFKYNSLDNTTLASLLGEQNICDSTNLFDLVYNFLTKNKLSNINKDTNCVSNFLNNLDSFDLNNYIKTIHFDKLKVPSVPFYKAKRREYYGIEEMKQGEIDFLKTTVLSKSTHDIFMCSDMPMEDMAKDIEFGKKWMLGIALVLKKGLKLNIIHNLDRPFNEMMLGLESWIPLYMTGQINPYYFKDIKNNVYQHLNYVSGSVFLTGECVCGHHSSGKYYLDCNNKSLDYYKNKMKLLINKAYPLMDIYNINNMTSFEEFLNRDSIINSNRKRILSSLPIFTIDLELLNKILAYNNVDAATKDKILKYKSFEDNYINSILKENIITDYLYHFNKKDFKDEDVYLAFENLFLNIKLKYSYSDYLKHLNLTKKYAIEHINYNIVFEKNRTFKNISITSVFDRYVILSKSDISSIHFVIRHPKLVAAINNFNPIVIEK